MVEEPRDRQTVQGKAGRRADLSLRSLPATNSWLDHRQVLDSPCLSFLICKVEMIK